MLSVLLALSLSHAADPLSACNESEMAVYIHGDQVYLRSGPSRDAEIIAALPWGTCLEAAGEEGQWTAVRILGHEGFVSSAWLRSAPPRRKALEDLHADSFCRAGWVEGGWSRSPMEIRALVWSNEQAGLDDYYIRPMWDDYCYSLRPAEWKTDTLGALERAATENLNHRLAAWTLMLAPESVYRQTPADILHASPLFRDFPGEHAPNQQHHVYLGLADEQQPLYAVFGSVELQRAAPPPEEVHLFHSFPEGGRLIFQPNDVSEKLGIAGGHFPAGRFRLSPERTVVEFDRELPAAVFDPCAGAFIEVPLTDIHYDPATGRFSAAVAADVQATLSACRESLPARLWPQFRFPILVDETPEGAALSAIVGQPVRRVITQYEYGYAVEYRWSEGDEDRAFLRAATSGDCGMMDMTIFQFEDSGWQRVQSWVHDMTDCGA